MRRAPLTQCVACHARSSQVEVRRALEAASPASSHTTLNAAGGDSADSWSDEKGGAGALDVRDVIRSHQSRHRQKKKRGRAGSAWGDVASLFALP